MAEVGCSAMRRAWAGLACWVLAAAGCSSDEGSAPTASSNDVAAILEESGPYLCGEQMISVVARMMDTGSVQPAQDAWGMPSPATEFAVQLWSMLTTVRYQEGVPVASEQLIEMATVACFDGDVANDVTRAEPASGIFVSACLDGTIPKPGDPVCDLATQASNDSAGDAPAPSPPPAPVEAVPSPPGSSDAGQLTFVDGFAPWDSTESATDAGIVEIVEQVRRDPTLADCPVLWPTDDRVVFDGTGEGGSGFANWGFEIGVETPGGSDYGGAALWRDGVAPFDTAFSPEAVIESVVLASGDKLTLAYGEYNEARIETATGCTWSFGAGSGHGLEVVLASLRTIE